MTDAATSFTDSPTPTAAPDVPGASSVTLPAFPTDPAILAHWGQRLAQTGLWPEALRFRMEAMRATSSTTLPELLDVAYTALRADQYGMTTMMLGNLGADMPHVNALKDAARALQGSKAALARLAAVIDETSKVPEMAPVVGAWAHLASVASSRVGDDAAALRFAQVAMMRGTVNAEMLAVVAATLVLDGQYHRATGVAEKAWSDRFVFQADPVDEIVDHLLGRGQVDAVRAWLQVAVTMAHREVYATRLAALDEDRPVRRAGSLLARAALAGLGQQWSRVSAKFGDGAVSDEDPNPFLTDMCLCWDSTFYVGAPSRAYIDRHLLVAGVSEDLDARLLVCPQVGMTFLDLPSCPIAMALPPNGVSDASQTEDVATAGAAAAQAAADERGNGGYL